MASRSVGFCPNSPILAKAFNKIFCEDPQFSNFEDEPTEPEKVNFKKETKEELVNRVMEKVHQRLESQKRTIERENKLGWTLENPERKNIEILDSFDLLRELNRSLQEPLAATQQLISKTFFEPKFLFFLIRNNFFL